MYGIWSIPPYLLRFDVLHPDYSTSLSLSAPASFLTYYQAHAAARCGCGLTYTCRLSVGGRSWALNLGAVTTSSGSSISPEAMATSW